MPAPERAFLRQTAVLWPKSGVNAYGQATVGSPVELRVRWEWTRSEVLDPLKAPTALDASVVVDRVIAVGSLMWLGELSDFVGTGSGWEGHEIYEVKAYEETPDLKNRVSMRTVGLMRYKGTLPG